MPKIQRADLPPAVRDHLFERVRERKISAGDLYALKFWRETSPSIRVPSPATTTRHPCRTRARMPPSFVGARTSPSPCSSSRTRAYERALGSPRTSALVIADAKRKIIHVSAGAYGRSASYGMAKAAMDRAAATAAPERPK